MKKTVRNASTSGPDAGEFRPMFRSGPHGLKTGERDIGPAAEKLRRNWQGTIVALPNRGTVRKKRRQKWAAERRLG